MKKVSPIKVLQLCPKLSGQGGVERSAVEMAEYLSKAGWGSYIASNGGVLTKSLSKEIKHFTIPIHKRTPWHIALNAIKLRKIIKTEGIQLLHARSRAPAWCALLASKMTGIPMITTFHGTHRIQNKFKYFYNSVMVRGEEVIANSEFMREHISKNYNIPAKNIKVAQRGFDPKRFSSETVSSDSLEKLKKTYKIEEDEVILVLVGRITRWKGHHKLIEALSHIKDIKWKLLIVGGYEKRPQYLEELKEQVKSSGLSKRVIFTGSQQNTNEFYALADLALSTSLEPEAFGRVAIEAQAMRTPVMATAHGGSLETIKDKETGFLYQPHDIKSMTKILRTAISDREKLKEMGDKAYTWVHDRFTTQQMCEKELDVYKEVLKIS